MSARYFGDLPAPDEMVERFANSAHELLKGIGAICEDITFYDDFSSPTIMVKTMKVGA